MYGSGHDWLLNQKGWIDCDGNYKEPDTENVVMDLNGKQVKVGRSIGFVLSHFGYDVWLANSRGNVYTTHSQYTKEGTWMKFKNLDLFLLISNISDCEYFEYSQDELIDYDAPATIDYVLNVTRKPTLGWIDVSLGSQMMLALLATQPKYSQLVKPYIGMAPQAFLYHSKSAVFWSFKFFDMQSRYEAVLKDVPVMRPDTLSHKICRNGLMA